MLISFIDNLEKSSNVSIEDKEEEKENINKEIIFELAPEVEKENKPNLVIETNNNVAEEPKKRTKDSSYESPQKYEAAEWDLKLPSIKSSSGHENLRNSEGYNILEVQNKENHTDSMSIELLDRSGEVSIFISPKELSPKNSMNNDQNSHIRNRINSLRLPEDGNKNLEEELKIHSVRVPE